MRVRVTTLTMLTALGAAVSVITAAGAQAASAADVSKSRQGGASPAPRPESGAPAARPRLGELADGLRSAGAGEARLVLRVAAGASLSSVAARARDAGAGAVTRRPASRVVAVEVPQARVATMRARLAALTGVTDVSEARRYRPTSTPSDPLYSSNQWHYFQPLAAEPAWDLASGRGVKVAVIDSGVDDTHPELAGKVTGRYNAVTGTEDASDADGHGTAVASVIAARSDVSGMAGAARDASVLAVKVAGPDGSMYSDAVAEGINWAAANGADVVNLSISSLEADDLTAAAVANARARGVSIVAAAGNGSGWDSTGDTVRQYPAAYSGVISVGATTQDGSARAGFSTYGSWVQVAAPGVGITVAVPPRLDVGDGNADGFKVMAGTSVSTPLVAGALALVRSRNPHLRLDDSERLALSHDGRHLGFARGNVSYEQAVAGAPDPGAPTVVQPAAQSSVSGSVAAVATAVAPYVRFSFAGSGISTMAPTVEGRAEAQVPSWGLSSAQTLVAVGCTSQVCGSAPATVPVQVQNAAPTLTSPSDRATVGTSVRAAASAGGGGVAFLVDGVRRGFDAVAPFQVDISTAPLADGNHSVAAVQCDTTGSRCDTTSPSAARTVDVRRLHPTLTVSPTVFSPNGDRRRDTSLLTYRLDQTQTVDLRVTSPTGAVVRSGRLATGRAAGTYTWSWNGRNNSGAYVANATYRVQVNTSAVVGGTTIRGAAARAVRVDRTRPGLTSLSVSPTTVYPVTDGYRDASTLRVTTSEALASLRFEVFNGAGSRVRVIQLGAQPAGGRAASWNGRYAGGGIVPAGSYTYRAVATDYASNTTTTARAAVSVSAKRLVAKTASRTVTPAASMSSTSIADCSEISTPGRSYWSGSYGYYSDYYYYTSYCFSTLTVAAARHSFTLPSAVKFGNVRVSAYGGAYAPGKLDTAAMIYYDRYDQLSDHGVTLGAQDASRTGPSVPLSSLSAGRTVSWLAGTVDGDWYDVKSFTVTWTYYALL